MRRASAPPPKPRTPAAPSAEEQALFRSAVAGTRPLTTDAQVFVTRTPLRPRRQAARGTGIPLAEPSEHELDLSDALSFKRTGVQPAVWRRLRRGEYPREARLDLHGRTVDEARELLARFLARARDSGAKCVLVVHGKGYRSPGHAPVLKPRIAYWLAHAPGVSAYVSALPPDGGTGALYVLLSRAN